MNKSGNTRGRQPRPENVKEGIIQHEAPPEWLTDDAQEAFYALRPHVQKIVQTEDLHLFYMLCQAYGNFTEATRAIKQDGLRVFDERNVIRKHPLLSVQKEAATVFNALCVKFGLSPVDRARLLSTQPEQELDLDDLLGA